MNTATVLVLLLLVGAVIGVILSLRKQGSSGCSGGCEKCAMKGLCRK